MRKIIIPILILFIGFFSSCVEEISSNDVPTEQILRNYYAMCINGGTTYVTAEIFTDAGLTIPPFREPFGGRVTLYAPSKVSFNGKEMEVHKDVFGDVTYRISVDGWPSNFRWEWTDKNGKKYSDSAKMDAINLESSSLVSDGDVYTVRWIGSPIKQGEEIAVSIEVNETDYYDTSNQVGAKKIKISGSEYGLDLSLFYRIDISRTLMIRNVKEISVENVAGSCIKLVYRHDE